MKIIKEDVYLLPCPFCGYKFPAIMKRARIRKAEDKKWIDASEFSVKCPMCIAQVGPIEDKNQNYVIKIWNTRKNNSII